MARRHRFQAPNFTYHVMLRGNNGHDIFFSNEDRYRMCLLIQQSAERFNQNVEAFCFMSNHIHLAIRVSETTLSKFMHYLAFRYARYINRKYNRIVHLFQGRFHSILVDDGEYFKELIRYIHLNPVRASIVTSPENYPWSSHRVYLGLDEIVWLSADRLLNKFHSVRSDAISNFNKYVLKGIGIQTEYDFKSGLVNGMIGDEKFLNQVLPKANEKPKKIIDLAILINKICDQNNLTTEEIRNPGKSSRLSHARALASLLSRETNGLSLEQLGKFLNRDPSGLTKLANRLEIKCSTNPFVAKQVQELRDWMATP